MNEGKNFIQLRTEMYNAFADEKNKRLRQKKLDIEKAIDEFNEEYEQFLKDMLSVYHLDARVIRRDGQEGELHVEPVTHLTDFMPYEYKFYPITKKGVLAQRPNGHVGFYLANYTPKEKEES